MLGRRMTRGVSTAATEVAEDPNVLPHGLMPSSPPAAPAPQVAAPAADGSDEGFPFELFDPALSPAPPPVGSWIDPYAGGRAPSMTTPPTDLPIGALRRRQPRSVK